MLTRRTRGDGLHVVFSDVHPAALCALELQEAVAAITASRSHFVREISAAARVQTRYAARFVTADATAVQPWFAVEYGPSLRGAVLRGFAVGVADALAAIGRARLVHPRRVTDELRARGYGFSVAQLVAA